MAKYFLVGVSDVWLYGKGTNDLIFSARTLTDTAIDISVDKTDINGGKGNALLYSYFHTSKMDMNLTDTQWNLAYIAANAGSSITTNNKVWYEETVTVTSGTGTVTKTPLVTPDSSATIYGWITNTATDATSRVTFTGSTFPATDGTYCVRYYIQDTASREVSIPANIIPANGRLVMECQLASSTTDSITNSTIVGKIQIEIPSFQLDGSTSLAMTSSGVSNSPLKGFALADTTSVAGCNGAGVYAKVREIMNNANWYDNVVAITALTDPVAISAGTPTSQIQLYAIPASGSAFLVPNYADIGFVSGTPATATVNASGLITRVTSGSTLISATVSARPTIKTTINVVSA